MTSPKTMLAAVYQSFNSPIQILEIPTPPCPPDGVIIQVKATGVCRSDYHGWKGHDADILQHGLPFTPGHEASGIITRIGPQISSFRIGDRVAIPFILSCGTCRECRRDKPTICERQCQPGFTMQGSFAEFLAIPRAERNICRIPDRVSFLQAAAMGCRFTTAYRAVVQQGRLEKGQIVTVFGCGGLGLSCVMIAIACMESPLKLIAVDVSGDALSKAKQIGAWNIVDASKGDEYVRRKINELTDGMGADLTIDAAGFASTCENAVYCTRRGGTMVQVGLPIGGRDPIVPMGLVAGREIQIIGSHGFDAKDMPRILKLVEHGKLEPQKLVEREVTLKEGARAIEDMDQGSPLGITMVTRFREQSRL